MADVAQALAARGYDVTVATSARGFENPDHKYARRERLGAVRIVRLPLSSFGKRTIALRLAGAAAYLAQACAFGLLRRQLRGIFFTTSPPMCSLAALAISYIRRVPMVYWIMDMNPDQYLAMGRGSERSLPVKTFRRLNCVSMRHAKQIIVLDRFMADRLPAEHHLRNKVSIIPPWPHEEYIEAVPEESNPFRRRYNLGGRLVFLYSGNHSPANPIDTFLHAALHFADDPRVAFVFIGGGSDKYKVETALECRRPSNIFSLPYQPLDHVKYSLSAGDVHVVTLGDNLVGIVHPCKGYAAISLGRPLLYFGPIPSPISELIEVHGIGWLAPHGDGEAAVTIIERILQMPRQQLLEMGRRAKDTAQREFSKKSLCNRLCDVIDRGFCCPG